MSGSPQLTAEPEALTLLGELDGVCETLAGHEDEVDRYAGRRNDLFRRLLAMGVTQREVAGRAKISEPAVAKAVRKATALHEAHEAGEHAEPDAGCPECEANATD